MKRLILLVLLLAGCSETANKEKPIPPDYCHTSLSVDALAAGLIAIRDFDPVPIDGSIDWSMDPFDHPSWRHRFHSLDFLWPAIHKNRIDAVKQVIDDWVQVHPIEDASPVWAADTTAKRTQLMACVQHLAPSHELATALLEHAQILASDEFYVGHHNHGISQDIALFVTGCVLEEGWMVELAEDRIATAASAKIDDEGMVDEQAPAYQEYVISLYRRYEKVADMCERDSQLPNMPAMQAALSDLMSPDGRLVPIGDTYWVDAPPESSTDLPSFTRAYEAGYFLHRTDDSYLAVRYGPGRTLHGHNDHTSVWWYAMGAPRIIEAGHVGYDGSDFRDYTRTLNAHNVVVVDGAQFNRRAETDLVSASEESMAVSDNAYRDIARDREVRFSSTMLKVEDHVTAATLETFHQLWHLPPDAHVTIDGTQALVSFPDGVLMVISQLEPVDDMKVIVGQEDPFMGWTALRGERIPTPVLVSTVTGESARFVTGFRLASTDSEP